MSKVHTSVHGEFPTANVPGRDDCTHYTEKGAPPWNSRDRINFLDRISEMMVID